MAAIVVWTAMPEGRSAQKLADEIVRKKMAACVSVLTGASSTYRWKGKIERARESFLMIKTSRSKWKALQKFLSARHPYELPELIALPVVLGSKKYLSWIKNSGL